METDGDINQRIDRMEVQRQEGRGEGIINKREKNEMKRKNPDARQTRRTDLFAWLMRLDHLYFW
jgi:hypothetical protein